MSEEKKTRILVVDDDPAMREVLKIRLEGWGFQVRLAGDGRKAQELGSSYHPDIVITDVVMPEVSGLELLRHLAEQPSPPAVILITGHGTVDLAVQAMKEGAHDFLTKPLDYSQLRAILRAAQGERQLLQRSKRLTSRLEKGSGLGLFVGQSVPMQQVYTLLRQVASSNVSVLITGESGTGKELAAKTIHQESSRDGGPFVAVNAAAIPSDLMESEIFGHEKGSFTGATGLRHGCFEQAHGGTLLLDEIAEMPVALQAKLLRVLEDGHIRRVGGSKEIQVDTRVLAATNQDPEEAVAKNRLRQDLYYRLNVFTVHLPPLRHREEDVPLLAQHFLSAFNEKHRSQVQGIRPETLELLNRYPWPGNVRELGNVLERAVVLAGERWIENSHLPPYFHGDRPVEDRIVLPAGISAAEAERELILRTLEQSDQNKAEAARRLGLDVKTIRNKLRSYGLM